MKVTNEDRVRISEESLSPESIDKIAIERLRERARKDLYLSNGKGSSPSLTQDIDALEKWLEIRSAEMTLLTIPELIKSLTDLLSRFGKDIPIEGGDAGDTDTPGNTGASEPTVS